MAIERFNPHNPDELMFGPDYRAGRSPTGGLKIIFNSKGLEKLAGLWGKCEADFGKFCDYVEGEYAHFPKLRDKVLGWGIKHEADKLWAELGVDYNQTMTLFDSGVSDGTYHYNKPTTRRIRKSLRSRVTRKERNNFIAKQINNPESPWYDLFQISNAYLWAARAMKADKEVTLAADKLVNPKDREDVRNLSIAFLAQSMLGLANDHNLKADTWKELMTNEGPEALVGKFRLVREWDNRLKQDDVESPPVGNPEIFSAEPVDISNMPTSHLRGEISGNEPIGLSRMGRRARTVMNFVLSKMGPSLKDYGWQHYGKELTWDYLVKMIDDSDLSVAERRQILEKVPGFRELLDKVIEERRQIVKQYAPSFGPHLATVEEQLILMLNHKVSSLLGLVVEGRQMDWPAEINRDYVLEIFERLLHEENVETHFAKSKLTRTNAKSNDSIWVTVGTD